ncbi:MAG: transposase [Beijerinckiaceae bacterium]
MDRQDKHAFTPALKAEAAFAAIRAQKSVEELACEYGVEPSAIEAWKAQLLEGGAAVFSGDVQVPRVLAKNPYGPEFGRLTLPQRVQMAADASAEVGRSIGAIVLHIGASEANVDPVDPVLVEDMAAFLAGKLNASDYAGVAGRSSIVLYVSLINTIDDLHAVARRLHHHAAHWLDASGHPEYVLSAPGVAYYPVDGLTADGLFDTASRRAREAQSQVITLRRRA